MDFLKWIDIHLLSLLRRFMHPSIGMNKIPISFKCQKSFRVLYHISDLLVLIALQIKCLYRTTSLKEQKKTKRSLIWDGGA